LNLGFLKSYQGFSTFDLLTLITSVTAVAAISGPIVQRSFQSERLAAADRDMKKLAFEIAQSGPKLETTTSREIASATPPEHPLPQIDPWGNPYILKFVRNSYGIPTHLVIWSFGPNGKKETSSIESSQSSVQKSGAQAVVFDGDDLGYITSVR
jgi:hypothetical protein